MQTLIKDLIKKYGEKFEKAKTIEILTELSLILQNDINKDIVNKEGLLKKLTSLSIMIFILIDIYDFKDYEIEEMSEKIKNEIKSNYLD